MDDLSSKLNEFLKDPESMEKIKSIAAMFGGSGAAENPAPAAAPPVQENAGPPPVDPDTLRTIMKIAPALSHFRQDDDATRLLRALRPLLGEAKRKKLDEAIRLMQLSRMIPFLKNSGLF